MEYKEQIIEIAKKLNTITSNVSFDSKKQIYTIKGHCFLEAKNYYNEEFGINLKNMIFKDQLSFSGFKKLNLNIENDVEVKELYINDCEELSLKFYGGIKVIDKISINKCNFREIFIVKYISGNIEFQKCNFNDFNLSGLCDVVIKGDFKFNFCEVKETANFMNLKFKNKAYFKMSKFKDNVYFNNSHFYDYANFHECEFEKMASFYGVKFEKVPNFFQAIFKGNLNAVNTNLNFDFDDLENKIKQEYDFYEKARVEKETGNLYPEKSLDKFANDFRDSFRVFKNALIKDNNHLDASNFHKYELYCKEIELKQSWNKLKNVKNDEDIKQNNSNYSQLVDFLLLRFYRKLCDHHTDISKSFNSLLIIIGIFSILSFFIILGFDYFLGFEVSMEGGLYQLLEFYNKNIKSLIKDHYIIIFFTNLVILSLYMTLLFLCIKFKTMRNVFIALSYVAIVIIMGISPKIILPVMGIFTDKRVLFDPLSVIGGFYTLMFGFVAYSFIKTIRKKFHST
ncbi:pentapeptide repeat-containing protein [Campylobacter molothri]|uniref:pentapeptide repeat-containing protein n=1 Tax=Campylobacter molothri TaxID=1032242 RepID=UPI003DA19073